VLLRVLFSSAALCECLHSEPIRVSRQDIDRAAHLIAARAPSAGGHVLGADLAEEPSPSADHSDSEYVGAALRARISSPVRSDSAFSRTRGRSSNQGPPQMGLVFNPLLGGGRGQCGPDSPRRSPFYCPEAKTDR